MKLKLTTIISCIVLFICAQPSARAQISLTAGYDNAQYTLEDGKYGEPFDGFTGEIGYTAKFLKGILGLNMAVNYSFHTRNNGKLALGPIDAKSSSQEQTLSVPLRLVLDIPVSRFGLVVYGGGFASYELSAIESYDFISGDTKTTIQYDYLQGKYVNEELALSTILLTSLGESINEPSSYKSYDYGLLIGGGVRVNNAVMIHASYNHGLCNRFSNENSAMLRKNCFSVKISFLF